MKSVDGLSRVERKRRARQEKMLTIALSIIEEDGLEALTIKRIADELDLVMGAIYRYFPGKSGLLTVLQMRALEHLSEECMHELERSNAFLAQHEDATPVVAGIVHVLLLSHVYFSFNLKFPAYHRLLDALLSSPIQFFKLDREEPNEGQHGERLLHQILGYVASSIQAALEECSEDESIRYAHILWATLHGLNHVRKRDRVLPEHLQSNALQPLAVRSLLEGWGLSSGAFVQGSELFQSFLKHA